MIIRHRRRSRSTLPFTLALLGLALAAATAGAEPITLRFATLAPDGTAWAREFKAFARDTEILSEGKLRMKWYFGGIAGDETAMPKRIAAGQLDGEAAGVSCVNIAPSLRVFRVLGLFRSREETRAVLARMRPALDAEFRKAGYVPLGVAWFGSDTVFSREPVRSLDDLRRTKLWIWDLDPVWQKQMPLMKMNVVRMGVEEAGRAYEEHRVDGFVALPTAALAFQWSTLAHYFTRLTFAALPACTIISTRAFDALPIESQQALRAAATKATLRFEDVTASQEKALFEGLFNRQGMKTIEPSAAFRADFFEATRAARDALPDSLIPRELLTRVMGWLSDFRADHP